MIAERVRWQEWDAVRLVARECEMLVGVSAGPRILSLRGGAGPNLLYSDATDFRVGDWRLYGGHRFTVAPEGAESYAPDNSPCAVEEGAHELGVIAPIGKDGLRRMLVIRPAVDGSGFDVQHVLENRGHRSWRGALWAITCVPSGGNVVAPRGPSEVRYWPGTDRAQWDDSSGHIVLNPGLERGKAGWHCEDGWIASLQPSATFVIHSPHAPARSNCVDEGCNLEVFTGPDYVELETLGGEVELAPGTNASHFQRWRLLAPIFGTRDWKSIGAQI